MIDLHSHVLYDIEGDDGSRSRSRRFGQYPHFVDFIRDALIFRKSLIGILK